MEATLGAKPEKKHWFGRRDVWITCAILIATSIIMFFAKLSTGPTSYEDCVLKNVVPGDSDRGAAVKADACRKKFPKNYFDKYD